MGGALKPVSGADTVIAGTLKNGSERCDANPEIDSRSRDGYRRDHARRGMHADAGDRSDDAALRVNLR